MEPRPLHIYTFLFGSALAGTGGYALWWGLRRSIGVDRSAVYTGIGLLVAGAVAHLVRLWLVRRRRDHWVEVDAVGRRLRLYLGNRLHSERGFESCQPVRVQEVYKFRRGGGASVGSIWTWFEVWVGTFCRPLYLSFGSRAAAARGARALADAVGAEVRWEPDRKLEADHRQSLLDELRGTSAEERLLEHLDPRLGFLDTATETAEAVTCVALQLLAQRGSERCLPRLEPLLVCRVPAVREAARSAQASLSGGSPRAT